MRALSVPILAAVLFLSMPSFASNHHYHAHYYRHHGYRAGRPPQKYVLKTQQHYSFLPPHQPSKALATLQEPLIGHLEHQSPVQAESLSISSGQVAPAMKLPAQPIPTVSTQPAKLSRPVSTDMRYKRLSHKHIQHVPERLTAENSWVIPLKPDDAGQISGIIADTIQREISHQTAIFICMTPDSQKNNSIPRDLQMVLKNRGFQIANTPDATAIPIRYRVSQLKHTLIVRIRINQKETARVYGRGKNGSLVAASPLTISHRSPE